MRRVADKYAGYGKVIFVSHSMALAALADVGDMEPATIFELDYSIGE